MLTQSAVALPVDPPSDTRRNSDEAMFEMDDEDSVIYYSSSYEEENEDINYNEEKEETEGVTANYQHTLQRAHRTVYTPGSSQPYGLPYTIECVSLDASPPYHDTKNKGLLNTVIGRIATHIVNGMRRTAYKEMRE